MAPMEKKRIVVVLGMHRSGTSAITRGLGALGVDLGDRLMPAKEGNNAKGFWEDLDINALNIEILYSIGHEWHSNPSITQSELKGGALQQLRLRAVELLRQKIQSKPIWGMKDPRISRLLVFWNDIFDHLELDASYVVVFRHPMSVARSLKQRDGFASEKSHYLWLEHVVPSIIDSRSHRRVVVDYDLFMDQPESQLLRIAERLGLPSDLNVSELTDYKANFLDEGLRHTRFQPEDLPLDPAVPKRVIEAYSILRSLAVDELSIDAPEVQVKFAQLSEHLQDISPATHYMTVLEKNISRLDQVVADREVQIGARNHILVERDEQITSLNHILAERDEQITSLNHILVERDEQITSLNHILAERDEQIIALLQSVSERDQHIEHLDRAVAERDSLVAALNRTVGDQATQINALLTSRSWRMTAPLRRLGSGTRALKNALPSWRSLIKQGGRFIYRRLPLTQSAKWRLRSFAFRHFGSIFGVKQVTSIAERAGNGRDISVVGPGHVGFRRPVESKGIRRILENLNQPAFPESGHSWACSRFMLHLWKSRPDVQRVFDLNAEEDRKNFALWYLLSARHEQGLPASAYPDYLLESLARCDSGSVRKIALEVLEANRSGTAWPDMGEDIEGGFASGLPGANLIGYARGEFGMGEHVRMVARACAKAGAPFTIIDFEETGLHGNRDTSVDAWISDAQKYGTNIFHINADAFPALIFHFGQRFFANRTNIGYWAWELANCPEEFDLALDMVDEVWAISDFVRDAFQQRSPVPVFNMPLAVSVPELQRQYHKGFFDIPEDSFAFLFTFDAASYLDRKNPLGVVSAFKRAFPGQDEKVCLILKTMNAQEDDPLWKQLKQEVDGDERIRLISSRMTRDEILGLNSVCDAFVSLHRSEGFGRCLAESMWLGKPVIATNYSGSRDFAREGTACVVDYRLIPIPEGRYPCWQGQVWADPDIDHASWFMRKLVDDAVFRAYIAKAGQDFIRKNFNEKTIGEKYSKRLEEIAARNRSLISTHSPDASRHHHENQASSKNTIVGHIDVPQDYAINMPPLRGTTELAGWAIADSGISGVEVFVDGQLLGQAHYGILRPDVGTAYPEMEASARSGFFWMMDTSTFRDGVHQLAVVVASRSGASISLAMNFRVDNSVTNYDLWLERNSFIRTETKIVRDKVDGMIARPLLSLVATPCGNPDLSLASDTLDSLKEQVYPDWEFLVDMGEEEGVELMRIAKQLGIEHRIVVSHCKAGGMAGLLRACKGSHVGMIDWGDRLDPRALFAVADTLEMDPSLDLIYSDEDQIIGGKRSCPSLKPAWSPSLFDGINYVGRLWFARKDLLTGSDQSFFNNGEFPEHDLLKGVSSKTEHVAHIPMVLYSRQGEARPRMPQLTDSPDASRRLPALEISPVGAASPLVSVIIPTCLGDLGIVEKCLISLFERTAYDNLEVILVVNNVADTEATRSFLSRWPAKVIRWEQPFNWSAINNFGARSASGEYLLFMNDDVEVIGRNWLSSMVRAASSPKVGAVGATLRYPNGTLQHTGIFLVPHGGGAIHAFRYYTGHEPELAGLLAYDHECTAVTGACLLTKATIFHSLGGFDEALSLVCNDVDYCVRLHANAYRCLVAANTELIHHEGISRAGIPETEDVRLFHKRWGHLLELGDPYINPNLVASRDAWVVNPEATGSLVGRRIELLGTIDTGTVRSSLT